MPQEKKIHPLDRAIIATLAYGATEQWPLTLWEVFRYLTNPVRLVMPKESGRKQAHEKEISLLNIYKRINHLTAAQIVGECQGFYFLRKRKKSSNGQKLVIRRLQREKIADKKTKRARRLTLYALGCLPFVRGIYLSGSLACGWTKKESDIDLLVIVKQGHLWTGRFLVSSVLLALGLKRTRKISADKACLNHFISTSALKIPLYSIYNAQTYVRLVPLLVTPRLHRRFLKENLWVKNYIFWGYGKVAQDSREVPQILVLKVTRFLLEVLFLFIGGGRALEKLLSWWQIRHIKKDPLAKAKGGRVVVDSLQIELHPQSPEKRIIANYNRLLRGLKLFPFRPERDSGLKK